jgi:putative SOS response-associated peptidase YedK
MCGRSTNKLSWAEIHALYRLTDARPNIQPRYNIGPTQSVPVIRLGHDGQRELAMLRWGLIPAWAKDEKIGYSTINARAETVAAKPAFRDAYRRRRCIVPASGFLEWRQEGRGKQPYHFHRKDDRPLSLAGLWERWSKGPEPVESFTIIVTDANATIRPFHERMPVVLADDALDAWLDPTAQPDKLAALLQPAEDDLLVADRVSVRVNNVQNDDPDCLAQSLGDGGVSPH